MESMPVVLDISSDEEQGFKEGPKSFDYDWIKEFLGVSDKESDHSDDVVVVGEVKPERKSRSSRPAAKDLDDDCVVLDGDPENRVTSVNESATESEELLIVGEKGQIACRDYPHPRHLCATFPFSSTPHERHCEKCHCYVCDLPAPCLKWGTGISSTDHCHATEKAEMWKSQRKNFKPRKNAPLTASTNNGNSLRMEHPQHNQLLSLGISQFSSNSISQNQASRLTTMRACPSNNSIPIMRACSTSLNSTIQNLVSSANTIPMCSATTNFTAPNGTNHGRCQESVSTSIRNRYQPHLVSRRLLGVCNNASQRDRRRGSSSLSPQLYGHHKMSNRVGGIGGTLTLNHSAHGSFSYRSHVNPVEQHNTYHDATGLSNDRPSNGWHNGWLPTNLPNDRTSNEWHNGWLPTNLSSYHDTSSVQPSLNFIDERIVVSEIQAYSQPTPLENSQNFYQSCIQGNDANANYVACLSSNQHGNEHQIRSQIGNAGGDIIQGGNSRQEASRQEPQPVEENQGKTSRNGGFSVLDLIWNENTSQNIEPLIESSGLQSTESINQPTNVEESDTLFAGSTNLSSPVDFENWLMEIDGALPYEPNILTPDSIPVVDTGTLFCDFDTSRDGLAHTYFKTRQ